MVPVCPDVPLTSLPSGVARSSRTRRWAMWSSCTSLPSVVGALVTFLWPIRTVQPDFVPLLESCGVYQAVTADLHPDSAHLQMLMGVMVDIMSPICDFHKVGLRLYVLNRRVPYPHFNKSCEGQRTVESNGEANWATSESWTRWRTIH
jgi:hypothetical protein